MKNFKIKLLKNRLSALIALICIYSFTYGLGTAEFSASSITVAENVSGGYVDITIQGDASGGTIGLLGIRYKSASLMTATHTGGTYSDDADNIYNAAALGTDSNAETDNVGTDIQVYFSGEASLTISIKIDDDNRWEGGPSGTAEYLAIELYEPGGALTVTPGNPNGDGSTNTSMQINITDNEASEPVLSFYNESTSANEHVYQAIWIVVDGDIGIGNVGGVAPTFTWEIVQGSSNDAIVDEAEHTGTYSDHATGLTGDVTFDETSAHNIDGNGSRQAVLIYYRAGNDSRSEPEEQLEIRFQSSSNTHCAITGGTHPTHIHKIIDSGACDYGDCYPEPYFTNATLDVNESGTSGNIAHTFTINLNGLTEIVPSTLNINVATTTGNNGAAETDISGSSIAVVFNSVRPTSQNVSFNVIDDAIYEGSTPETITLTIEDNPTGFKRNADRTVQQVVSINDNETVPIATFHTDYDPTAANENAGNPDIRLKLDKVSQIPTNITISGGSTGSGVQATGYQDRNNGSNGGRYDYWLGAGSSDTDGSITYTVPAFTTSGAAGPVMDLTINDDAFFESNESFRLTLSGADSDASASATHDFTINQNNSDDQLPIISFETASEVSFTENGSSDLVGTIPVKLIDSSGDALVSGKDVTFSWSVTNADADGDGVSAVVNQDYMLKDADGNNVTSGTIAAFTDPPVFNIPFTVVGDNTAEENKKITITMTIDGSVEGVDATVAGAVSVTKTIQLVNDDADPEIQFAATTATIGEGSSSDSDDIVLQKVYSGSVDATEKTITAVVTAAGTGIRPATDNNNADGDDYDLTTSIGSISFGVNDATVVISLDVDDDDYYENTELVTFTIASVTNGTDPTSNNNLVLTINDADSAPVISFDTDNNETSKAEGNRPILKVLQNIKSQYTTAIVNYALFISGDFTLSDFSTSASSVSLPPNSLTAVQLPIDLADDALFEDNETMLVRITANSNCTVNTAKDDASITIIDNDNPPILSFELTSSSPNEGTGGVDATQQVKIQLLDPNGSGNEQPLGRSGGFSYSIAGSGTNSATETADWVLSTDPGTNKTVSLSTSGGQTASSFIVILTLKDDDVFEYDEQLTLSLTSSPTNLTLTGANTTHVMTINEIEAAPLVGFSSTDAVTGKNETTANTYTPRVVMESGRTSDFDVKIVWDIDEAERYSNTIEHAAAGSGHPTVADYTMANSAGVAAQRTVTISAGDTYVDLPTITFNGDSYYEDAEYFILQLSSAKYYNASDAEVGTNSWLSTTSTDHDQQRINIDNTSGAKPTVEWASPSQSSTEPAIGNTTVVNLGVTLDVVAAKDLKVKYSLLSTGYTSSNEYENNNAAEESEDFEFSQANGSKIITIPKYSLVNVSIPTLTIKSEAVDTYEMNEDIRVTLEQWSNADDATSGDADGANVNASQNEILGYTINERTTAPVLEFSDSDNALAYDESASARQIRVQFKSGGTQRAAMPVYAYLSIDASNSTGLNGTDFGSNNTPDGFADDFEVVIPALSNSQTFNFHAVVDNRYEDAQTAHIDLNTYASGALPSGKTFASNATDDGDETMVITINASGSSEKPVVQWVDNSSGSVPYSVSSGSRGYAEDAGTGYFTLQLATFSEKNITVNYALDETEVTSDPPTLIADGHASNNAYPIDYNYWSTGSDGTGNSSALSGTGTGNVTFTGVENNVSASTSRQYINIPVAILNDVINEFHETIILKIDETGNDDVAGAGAIDKLIIQDDDDPPKAKFTTATSGGSTDESTIASSSPNFTLGLYDPSTGSPTVSGKKLYFSVVTDAADASPGADKDFIALTDTENDWVAINEATDLLEASGQATITLDINDDLIDEEDQKVTISLDVKGSDYDGSKSFNKTTSGYDTRDTDAATDGDQMTHTYTIKDDDAEPVLMFSEASSTVDEGSAKEITIQFDDSSPNIILSEKAISVDISVSETGSDCGSAGGCATPSSDSYDGDYTAILDNTTHSISVGSSSTSFSITPRNDTRSEFAQDIVIKMDANSETNASVRGGTGNQTYVLTINDDVSDVPTVQFYNSDGAVAIDEAIPENQVNYNVTVKLDKVSEKVVTIPYSVDFTRSTAIIADDVTNITTSTVFPSDWVGWGATAGSSALSFSDGDSHTLHTATGTLTISAAAGTTADNDFQSETFSVTINNDNIDEDTESIYFALGDSPTNTNGGGAEFRLDITDDDSPIRYAFSTSTISSVTSGDEDASPVFGVEILNPADQTQVLESGKTVQIKWTMNLDGGDDDPSEANDFNLPASFNAGQAEGTIDFSPRTSTSEAANTSINITNSTIDFNNADGTYEPDESFSLTLSAINPADAEAPDPGRSAIHKYKLTNKDALPQISFRSGAFTLYERAALGDNSINLDFSINTNSTQKSELPIRAYFKIVANSDSDFADADIDNSDGIIDYSFGGGALTDNQVVTIAGSASDLATVDDIGTITISIDDDTIDEPEEKFKVHLITYDINSPEASQSPVSDSGISNATAPDGPNVGVDTGFDEAVITIATDPDDLPEVFFYNASSAVATSSLEVAESSGGADVTFRLNQISGKDVTIPYTLTLDYIGDEKTARLGTSIDTDYPYDFRGWNGLTITGDGVSSNNVTATGTITIVAGQQSGTIPIVINNDNIYEFDETIKFSIGTTANPNPTNANKSASNNELTITITNDGEAAPTLVLNRALQPDNNTLIVSSTATSSSFSEAITADDETTNNPYFEVKLVDGSGSLIEAGMDLKFSYVTTSTSVYTINPATAGSDYIEVTSGIITINKGEKVKTFSVDVLHDEIDEEDQNIVIDISKIGYDSNGDDDAEDSASGDDSNALVDGDASSRKHIFTILDDDDPPVLSFYVENGSNIVSNVETQTVTEKKAGVTGTHVVTVKANSISEKLISVKYSQLTSDSDCPSNGNCAESGSDFEALADLSAVPFTIIAGKQTNTFTITTIDDDRDEWDQDIILELSIAGLSTPNATISSSEASGPPKYRLIIEDSDDDPFINFATAFNTFQSSKEVTEGNDFITKVYLSHISEKDVTIGYTFEAEASEFGIYTATPSDGVGALVYSEDHSGLSDGSEFFINNAASNSDTDDQFLHHVLTVFTTDDNIDEWDEKFKITLNPIDHSSNPTVNAKIGSDAPSIIATIVDNDAPESVAFTVTSATENENVSPNSINIPVSIEKQSGKDIVLKYSIDNTINYPSASDFYFDLNYSRNENIATRGHDYNFGSVTTNSSGDSIITILAGSTTANIPLIILDDDFDEYDQILRVKLSLANSSTWTNDPADPTYDSFSGGSGAEASLGANNIYTFTIKDNDIEPYVQFESNAASNETDSGTNTELVTVSLIDGSGASVISEKTITMDFALDTDRGEDEMDYTSASLDSDDDGDKYLDDFKLTDGQLTFSGYTYTYSTVTSAFTKVDGESAKDISLIIYGDDLYEVNEYINIELSTFENSQTSELNSGDFSYVHTITNDDGMPAVTWVGANSIIQEGDPTSEDNKGDYQNTEVLLTLSKETGTDILVEYSEKAGGTAESGSDNNYDFYLGTDNTDLSAIGVNTKSVIIPSFTSASSSLTRSVPIDIWDDDVVEKTLIADNENFLVQIDGYRDKGPDGSWATDDDNKESVINNNEFEVTIFDNDLPPADFTVQDVLTKTTSTADVIPTHWNPITAGYWNSYNTGLSVTVPIENNSNLIGGNVRLIAKVDGFVYRNLTTPAQRITSVELEAGTFTFDVSSEQFEGTVASPTDWFAEGNEVLISAVITDSKGNETYGTESATTIKIDETLPVIANYVITSAVSSGGTVVTNYWNNSNTGLDVSVTVQSTDASVSNGSIIILAGVGTDENSAVYEQLGDPVSILPSNNIISGIVTASITKLQVENQTEYGEDKTINLKAEIADIAGNKVVINVASTKIFIDTTLPTISRVESIDTDDGSARNGIFGIDSTINLKFTFSENITLTEGVAQVGFDNTIISVPEIASADLQNTSTVIMPYTVQANDVSSLLTFTNLTLPTGNKLRDIAGNDMEVFTANNGFSLEDLSVIEVDGLAPSSFSVDTVYVQGVSVVQGYWNSNSTSLIIPITNPIDVNTGNGDLSLVGGKVQILGRVYNTATDAPGSFVNVGTATILVQGEADGGGTEPSGSWNLNSPFHYGQFPGKTLHFEIDASTMETALSDLENYPDKSAANPGQNGKIDFVAIIIDRAGNRTQGSTTEGSQLIVDEVMPLDPAIGLPSSGYNYSIAPSIDNYVEIVPDTDVNQGFSRQGYFNSTNTGVTFRSWISYDDGNPATDVDRDASLIGGTAQVQMASTGDASTASWTNIGNSVTIQEANVTAGFVNISVDSADIRSVVGDFIEGNTLFFRNIITDKAGNITEQSSVSSKTLLIDTTPHQSAELSYSRKYVNGEDHNPIVTIAFNSSDFPFSAPKLSATFKAVSPIDPAGVDMTIVNGDSSVFSYELDIPGTRGINTWDDVVNISISATDKAGNPILQDVITNKDYLIVDNTPPTVLFSYENTSNTLNPYNAGKFTDDIKVTASLSEPMFESLDTENPTLAPTLSADPLSSAFSTDILSDKAYTQYNSGADPHNIVYTFKLPNEDATFIGEDLKLKFLINGTDWAGNPVDPSLGYENLPSGEPSHIAFRYDNKSPIFKEFGIDNNAYINDPAITWYNDNNDSLSSASVQFFPVNGSVASSPLSEGDEIPLIDGTISGLPNELDRGSQGALGLNNSALLSAALADSNTYDIIFKGIDKVGNVGTGSVTNVAYDTKSPTVKIEYTNEFITSLDEGAGTIIKFSFNEVQTVAPTCTLYYTGIQPQNSINASWTVANIATEYIDTSDPSYIEGPFTLVEDPEFNDGKNWIYVIDSDDVKSNTPELTYDNFVWIKLSSMDLAGNSFSNNNMSSSDFINSLFLDNTVPTATFTYSNLRDTLLTAYSSSNSNESYCCFAVAGDSVLVKVEMNEEILDSISSPPTLSIEYNSNSGIEGNIETNIQPISHPQDVKDALKQTGTVFHYKIVVQDTAKNDGVLKLTLNANDRSGTPVVSYGNSLQKTEALESRYALEIDNIHPWGYQAYPIFNEQQSEVTFPTEQFLSSGFRIMENWINGATDSIYFGVLYQNPTSDSSLVNNNPNWGAQGKIDIQVRNIYGTGQWQTLGNSDTLRSGTPETVPFGDYAFNRKISRSIDYLTDSITVLNVGDAASNGLQFRAVLADINGNITFGQISDAFKANDDNLYISDMSNMDTVGFDIASPSLGDFNDGNFNNAIGSKIISTDTISISWSEFTDPGGSAASGVDLYEMQVYVYPSTWTGGTAADTLGRIDSLFTVDMDFDGIDDSEYWYKIYKEQAPSFNNPIILNTLDSLVLDSISNTNITYDYNDTLKHELHYMIFVRAFDAAGNASDTIYTNAIQRYNSAPVFVDNINDLNLFEDIAWDYDTLKVSDLDLSTLQNDSFTYFIEPRKLTPNIAGGFDTSNVQINPPIVDPITGLVSWTPIQESTQTLAGIDTIIDQSGEYLLTFYAEDAFGFRDTINYNATVNAVNDTPVVAILGEDKILSWREDKPVSEIIRMNLSDYVKDIDNLDSELSWQFVIMDTSQLDEDFPIASVIVGPGTPKGVQTKLMKQYMGFDPSKGIDIPTLARKSGNTTMQMLSTENSLISIDIDTTTDENTYAIFSSDSNYYGSNHRIIFSAFDPFGAFDKDTVIVNILPENDPPIVTAIDTIVINENDSIWIDFSQYTTDVDDSNLTFTIEGIYNTDSINYYSEPYLSDGKDDTVLFDPFDLWSGFANFRLTASDEDAESSQIFTLNVLRVPRPDIEVSLVQNNAFSSYVSIIIIDKEQKTKFLQLEVQNQRIEIDTVASFTYTGDFSFGIGGGYSFDVLAVAEVGKTIYTNTFNLAPARVSSRWYASSSDGKFSVNGDPGSVDSDQNFLIVDSSLFINNFSDKASYVLGDETYMFNKPIEIHFGSVREDLSIYQRENGVIWKELPSINRNGQILTYTENAGYFRLGPKTIIVPEETNLHQNYPNPFNPSTTIKYDIGLMDGLEQRVSVNVYNVAGQHITTIVNNVSQVGQFYVKWDGIDKFGKMLPSGIYFVQLKTESGIIKNKKMMFLK